MLLSWLLLSVIPPIVLSILAMFLWRGMIRGGELLMVGRGMLVLFLADLLTAITSFLVVTIYLLPAIFIFNSEGLGFIVLSLYTIIVAQFLYALPFLLLAGALIARWQARSQATTA